MPHILVSGSLAYDRIMDFEGLFKDHFLPDKLHSISVSFTVEEFVENFGGTAGNISYNLACLGIQSKIISTAGSDFDRYHAHLQARGIDLSATRFGHSHLTSSAFIITDKDDNQIAAFSVGAGGEMYLPMPDLTYAICAVIGAGNEKDMRAFAKHYQANNLPYMYDPGQRIPMLSSVDLQEAIGGAQVLFGNDYEIGLISQKTGWSEKLLANKAQVVVITYGKEGTRILTKEGEKKVAAAPVARVADPTGAGDAYRAGYLAGYINKQSSEVCAQIGSVAAAYAVERYGTQNHQFSKAEFATRYETSYGQKLPF